MCVREREREEGGMKKKEKLGLGSGVYVLGGDEAGGQRSSCQDTCQYYPVKCRGREGLTEEEEEEEESR